MASDQLLMIKGPSSFSDSNFWGWLQNFFRNETFFHSDQTKISCLKTDLTSDQDHQKVDLKDLIWFESDQINNTLEFTKFILSNHSKIFLRRKIRAKCMHMQKHHISYLLLVFCFCCSKQKKYYLAIFRILTFRNAVHTYV